MDIAAIRSSHFVLYPILISLVGAVSVTLISHVRWARVRRA